MGKALLSAGDIARHLGVSRRTFESLIKEGKAPRFIWVGHQRRWRPEDVEDFVNQKLADQPGQDAQ